MKKPNWDDAPDWARYLAMDDDHRWFWHENKPAPGEGEWLVKAGSVDYAGQIKWDETLEERP